MSPLVIEEGDRRYAVIRSREQKLKDEWWKEFYHWFYENNGINYVMDYLLNYDLTGYNPHSAAIDTMAKQQMISDGQNAIVKFVIELTESDDAKESPLMTIDEIMEKLIEARLIANISDYKARKIVGATLTNCESMERQIRFGKDCKRYRSVTNFAYWKDNIDNVKVWKTTRENSPIHKYMPVSSFDEMRSQVKGVISVVP